jgi:hypothetical protein
MANQKSLDTLYEYIQSKRSKGNSYNGIPVYDVTKSDLAKLGQIADKYGIPVEWLANLINHESAGTFNPAIQNRNTRATGLIQFMPSTAADKPYLTTVDYLKTLNFSQSLDYVDMYLNKNLKKVMDETGKVKPTFNQTDLFMTIFYPVAVGDPTFPFPQKVQNANGGIKTPMDYTQKALRNPPFPLEQYPSNLSEFLKKYGSGSKDNSKSFSSSTRKWWVVPTIVVTFGVITTMIVYIYKKRKNG